MKGSTIIDDIHWLDYQRRLGILLITCNIFDLFYGESDLLEA